MLMVRKSQRWLFLYYSLSVSSFFQPYRLQILIRPIIKLWQTCRILWETFLGQTAISFGNTNDDSLTGTGQQYSIRFPIRGISYSKTICAHSSFHGVSTCCKMSISPIQASSVVVNASPGFLLLQHIPPIDGIVKSV